MLFNWTFSHQTLCNLMSAANNNFVARFLTRTPRKNKDVISFNTGLEKEKQVFLTASLTSQKSACLFFHVNFHSISFDFGSAAFIQFLKGCKSIRALRWNWEMLQTSVSHASVLTGFCTLCLNIQRSSLMNREKDLKVSQTRQFITANMTVWFALVKICI